MHRRPSPRPRGGCRSDAVPDRPEADRELFLTGDLIDAAEAERIGLINRVAPTKLMLNRAMDAAGFAAAVEMGLDLQSFVNMSATAREFDAIVRRDGLKAALAWRDHRYEERLAGRVDSPED